MSRTLRPNSGSGLPPIIVNPSDPARLEAARALFKECLRRYKEARDNGGEWRTDDQIVEMGLRTLIKNGYSRAEVMEAMS